MPSSTAYSSTTALQMMNAINQLQADYGRDPSNIPLLRQDLANYYSVQESVRDYAGFAVGVVEGSDYNGRVADNNLEAAFHDTSFGSNEINIAFRLATQDWRQITNGGSINVGAGGAIFVPTIVDDDLEHAAVFSNGGPGGSNILPFWSAAAPAFENVAWFQSRFGYEMQGVATQSASFPALTPLQEAQALGNDEIAGLGALTFKDLNATSIAEIAGDTRVLNSTIDGYAAAGGLTSSLAQFGMSIFVPQASAAELTLNAAQLDSAGQSSALAGVFNATVNIGPTGTSQQIVNYNNGTSTVRLLNPSGSVPFQTEMFGGANGTGMLLENATLNTANAVSASVYGNVAGQDITGSSVTLQNPNLSFSASGTGFTLAGQSSDAAWLGNAAQGVLSGLGTVGFAQGDTATVSNANLVFGANSSATVTGSNNAAGLWGNNASFTGSNSSVTAAGTLSGLSATGTGLRVSLGASDTISLGGTGMNVTGQTSDTAWTANGVSGSISGVGTIGIAAGERLTTSNATLVFGAGSSGVVTGSGNNAQFWGNNASFTGNSSTASVAANLSGVSITGQNNSVTLGGNATISLSGTGSTVTQQGTSVTWLANNANVTVKGGGTVGIANNDTLTANSTSLVLGTGSTLTLIGTSNTVAAYGNNASISGSGNLVSVASGLSGIAVTGGNNTLTVAASAHVTMQGTLAQIESDSYAGSAGDLITFNDTTDNVSQVQNWSASGNVLFTVTDYAGLNASGAIKDTTTDYTNGTSKITWNNPQTGISQVTGTYSGYNGTGQLLSSSFTQSAGNIYDYSYIYNGNSLADQWQEVLNQNGIELANEEFDASGDLVDDQSGNYSDTYNEQMIFSYGPVGSFGDDGDGDAVIRTGAPVAGNIFQFVGSGGADVVTLSSAEQTVDANGGAMQVYASAANAGAAIMGAAGAVLHIVGGGDAVLNGADTDLAVQLDQATTLSLGAARFIHAIGSSGSDRITAGASLQTLTGGAGADTLIGSSASGDVFQDTAAGLSGDTIVGFGGSDAIDVTDLAWAPSISHSVTEGYAGATLHLSGSAGSLSVSLQGFGGGPLTFGSDGHGGTLIALGH